MELPRGATGLDFAYAVHTDIGNSCVAIKIDKQLSPLSTPLQSGQTVEVITAPNAAPRSVWLNYAVTAKARHSIRHYLKTMKENEAVDQGRLLLQKALSQHDTRLEDISDLRFDQQLEVWGYPERDALYRDIGLGERVARLIARDLLELEQVSTEGDKPILIHGVEGMVLSFAKCCSPIPGDPIVGLMSPGRGMVVHRSDCANVRRLDASDRVISVEWADELDNEFPVNIRVLTENQRGVLAQIATAISSQQGDIANVTFSERDAMSTNVNFTVNVRDRKHLAEIMRHLRGIPEVLKLTRLVG